MFFIKNSLSWKEMLSDENLDLEKCKNKSTSKDKYAHKYEII